MYRLTKIYRTDKKGRQFVAPLRRFADRLENQPPGVGSFTRAANERAKDAAEALKKKRKKA